MADIEVWFFRRKYIVWKYEVGYSERGEEEGYSRSFQEFLPSEEIFSKM